MSSPYLNLFLTFALQEKKNKLAGNWISLSGEEKKPTHLPEQMSSGKRENKNYPSLKCTQPTT